jgi:hypothetical protein
VGFTLKRMTIEAEGLCVTCSAMNPEAALAHSTPGH